MTARFRHIVSQTTDESLATMSKETRESVKASFHDVYVELSLLRDYSSLNYTGFSKILKKHDKLLPLFKMKGFYFRNSIHRTPVFGVLDQIMHMQAECLVRFVCVLPPN